MLLLAPKSCLYVKAIMVELFSHDNGLKKNPGECFPQFTGRENKLRYDTVAFIKPFEAPQRTVKIKI